MMKVHDTKMKVFTRDGFTCQKCKKMFEFSDLELAHRIMKGKAARRYIRSWYQERFFEVLSEADIDRIIHHPLNLVTSCKKCNSSFNCFNNYCETEILLTKIIRAEGLGL
ncbi:MAG: hypothetical protein PF637_05925 [Spirochaetes bacterium]|nr:hypothetical protein [Spirochaetota bacterium]